MSRGPAAWVSPIVAVLVLAATVAQTLGALRVTGAFGSRAAVAPAALAPVYQSLDRALERQAPRFELAGLRDPFAYGPPPAPPVDPRPHARQKPPVVPVLERPILTAIVWDNDPRALVRWKSREWTIREGGLFDVFQVLSIGRDQVTLKRGDSTLVLSRRKPGE